MAELILSYSICRSSRSIWYLFLIFSVTPTLVLRPSIHSSASFILAISLVRAFSRSSILAEASVTYLDFQIWASATALESCLWMSPLIWFSSSILSLKFSRSVSSDLNFPTRVALSRVSDSARRFISSSWFWREIFILFRFLNCPSPSWICFSRSAFSVASLFFIISPSFRLW